MQHGRQDGRDEEEHGDLHAPHPVGALEGPATAQAVDHHPGPEHHRHTHEEGADLGGALPVVAEGVEGFEHEHQGQERKRPGEHVAGHAVALDEVGQALVDEPALGASAHAVRGRLVRRSPTGHGESLA